MILLSNSMFSFNPECNMKIGFWHPEDYDDNEWTIDDFPDLTCQVNG